MAESPRAETTNLLRAWAEGDEEALNALVPRVHRESRRLAGHFLQKERAGLSLQATDLVQEVYLRLVNASKLDWQHRAHFFAVSATMMRRILLDRARRRSAAKRGDGGSGRSGEGRRSVLEVVPGTHRTRRGAGRARRSRPSEGAHCGIALLRRTGRKGDG